MSEMTVEKPGVKLPRVEGKIHGIVGWDPIAVQCDDCLTVWRGGMMILTVKQAIFNKREPGQRLCAACWAARGWEDSPSLGWQRIERAQVAQNGA